jgi:SET domain-containing protein
MFLTKNQGPLRKKALNRKNHTPITTTQHTQLLLSGSSMRESILTQSVSKDHGISKKNGCTISSKMKIWLFFQPNAKEVGEKLL